MTLLWLPLLRTLLWLTQTKLCCFEYLFSFFLYPFHNFDLMYRINGPKYLRYAVGAGVYVSLVLITVVSLSSSAPPLLPFLPIPHPFIPPSFAFPSPPLPLHLPLPLSPAGPHPFSHQLLLLPAGTASPVHALSTVWILLC